VIRLRFSPCQLGTDDRGQSSSLVTVLCIGESWKQVCHCVHFSWNADDRWCCRSMLRIPMHQVCSVSNFRRYNSADVVWLLFSLLFYVCVIVVCVFFTVFCVRFLFVLIYVTALPAFSKCFCRYFCTFWASPNSRPSSELYTVAVRAGSPVSNKLCLLSSWIACRGSPHIILCNANEPIWRPCFVFSPRGS